MSTKGHTSKKKVSHQISTGRFIHIISTVVDVSIRNNQISNSLPVQSYYSNLVMTDEMSSKDLERLGGDEGS